MNLFAKDWHKTGQNMFYLQLLIFVQNKERVIALLGFLQFLLRQIS